MSSLERISLDQLSSADEFARQSARLHMQRYEFAAKYAPGCTVLDIACGIGYGSALLFDRGASSVMGVDIDDIAVAEASVAFARRNVQFIASDYRLLRSRLPADMRFDMIVSLETIEHIPDPDDFLNTLSSYMNLGGILIASVPVTPSIDANPYHFQDFTQRSLRQLLHRNGIREFDSLIQRQSFNPLTLRRTMERVGRRGMRRNLATYYLTHPSAFGTRVLSTIRYGFTNLVEVIAAEYRPSV